MGLALIVDARGDKIVIETGFDKQWTAGELFRGGGGHHSLIPNTGEPPSNDTDAPVPNQGDAARFWCPYFSEWFCARPMQFSKDWNAARPEYSRHLVTKDQWTFSPSLTPNDWFFNDTPEAPGANDPWVMITPEDTTVSVMNVNFANIAKCLGAASFESTPKVFTQTRNQIDGRITPYFQWISQPSPKEAVILGFADFAFVIIGDASALVRNTDFPGHQDWQLVATRGIGHVLNWAHESDYKLDVSGSQRSLAVIPIGDNELYLTKREARGIWWTKTRPDANLVQGGAGIPFQLKSGNWWIAATQFTKMLYQVQTVGYETASFFPPTPPTTDPTVESVLNPTQEWFNLGQEYTPTTTPPDIRADILFFTGVGDTLTTEFPDPAIARYTNPVDNSRIEISMLNQNYNLWSSDGHSFRGAFQVGIFPNTLPAGFGQECWSPQIRKIQLVFPAVLQDRPANEIVLYDQRHENNLGQIFPGGFKPGWDYTSGLREPRSNRLDINLTTFGTRILEATGLDNKHDYSIVFCLVGAPGDAVQFNPATGKYFGEVIRAWVSEPMNKGELSWGAQESHPIRDGEIHARGMMERANESWNRMSVLQPLLNAKDLFHQQVITVAFQQSGIVNPDPSNPTKIVIGPDTADQIFQIVPGYATIKTGDTGMVQNLGYAPDWDEKKIEYAWRIANDWRKWLLYERTDGTIVYQKDPIDFIYEGLTPTLIPDLTLWKTSQDAMDANADHRLFYHTLSHVSVQPVSTNFVRIIPALGTIPQVIIQDLRGCKQPNPLGPFQPGFGDPTYENYVGFVVRPAVFHPKLGNNIEAIKIIAAQYLLRRRRRIVTRTVGVRLPPWEMGIDLNSAVAVYDSPDPNVYSIYQVVKLQVTQLGNEVYDTLITGERQPAPPNFGV